MEARRGGGKSDLILGAAGGHKRSIIFRREYPQLKGIIDRSIARLDRSVETMPIRRFRDFLGVPPDGYNLGDNFIRSVLQPALLEVNGLSDMGVSAELVRRHCRAPIHAVTIAWWRKVGDEFREAIAERNRSKVGRRATLKELAERKSPPAAEGDAISNPF
jgi:hypothetical protein